MDLTVCNMCSQAKEDDVPLSQVFRRSATPTLQDDTEKCDIEEHDVTSPKRDEKTLRTLEERVAAVETTLGNAMGGITNILSFMEDIKRHFPSEAAPKTGGDVSTKPVIGVGHGTSTPPQWYVHGRPENTHEKNALTSSHTSSAKETPPDTDVPRGTCSRKPLVLPEDDSSGSAENDKVAVRVCPSRTGPASRVHSNPRMRPVPHQGKVAVSGPSSSREHVVPGPSGTPTSRMKTHKDPPQWDNVEDYGRTSETQIELPVLRPKNNTVIASHPLNLSCFLDCFVFVHANRPCRVPRILSGMARTAGFCTQTSLAK